MTTLHNTAWGWLKPQCSMWSPQVRTQADLSEDSRTVSGHRTHHGRACQGHSLPRHHILCSQVNLGMCSRQVGSHLRVCLSVCLEGGHCCCKKQPPSEEQSGSKGECSGQSPALSLPPGHGAELKLQKRKRNSRSLGY